MTTAGCLEAALRFTTEAMEGTENTEQGSRFKPFAFLRDLRARYVDCGGNVYAALKWNTAGSATPWPPWWSEATAFKHSQFTAYPLIKLKKSRVRPRLRR